MIRRLQGGQFWLFTQAEQARVAAELARHLDTASARLVGPSRKDALVAALAVHEAGWTPIDANPPLSPQRYPLDALEAHWSLTFNAWGTTTDEALKLNDDYVALLVSVHGLQLSYDAGRPTERASRFDPHEMRKHFMANKFQHRQIEIQEELRPRLGMAIDEPRRLGIAVDLINDGKERTFSNDYRWMQALDLMSLSLLATDVVAAPLGPIYSLEGQLETLRVSRVDASTMTVSPWPFAGKSIRIATEYREYPAAPTRSQPEFQHAYAGLDPRKLELLVRPL
ncbi:MAG: DUF3891 family protein [Tepidisphaeraceae bacterium]